MVYLGSSYRTYALDFWGFGESGKKRDTYAVQDFVTLVDQFMDRLGISDAPLVGHSMGGTVSLSVALQFPHRASKVVIVGSPIVGSSLAPPLKLAGYRFVAFMLFNMMWAFRGGMKLASPFICADPQFPQMMDRDLSSTTLESFLRSIASLRRTDLRPMLSQIKIPTMGIFGGRDNIVSPHQWQPLLQGVPHAKVVVWERAQHFVMLDMAKEFTETLKAFLDEEEKPAG
jgi:pimeloyl-ACP methyl ester carboxylesterase